MRVLLSIKPEFVERIFDGSKKYEYRKSIFKRSGVRAVVIYASTPVKRVVGEFLIEDILTDDIDTIWELTKNQSGITRTEFQLYFHQKTLANAIKIGAVTKYDNPMLLSDLNIENAPQSYCYISD